MVDADTCNLQHALKRAERSECLSGRKHPEKPVLETLGTFGRIETPPYVRKNKQTMQLKDVLPEC